MFEEQPTYLDAIVRQVHSLCPPTTAGMTLGRLAAAQEKIKFLAGTLEQHHLPQWATDTTFVVHLIANLQQLESASTLAEIPIAQRLMHETRDVDILMGTENYGELSQFEKPTAPKVRPVRLFFTISYCSTVGHFMNGNMTILLPARNEQLPGLQLVCARCGIYRVEGCGKHSVQQKCHRCGKTEGKLAKCGKCLKVRYCSPECQRTDWANHKKCCNV
jgi:hypothetical protein